ncbi:MAG TPA: TetR/AcrR family transcriptional regulator [Pseudonocardiaceae bacterium]|nr:TetR/AcrR family transcriptional regulator [Pseudonocardiaceae bacterium]
MGNRPGAQSLVGGCHHRHGGGGDPETPDEQHGGQQRLANVRPTWVRAAFDVFLREGYARASVDAIAAEAGVSTRTIYDYYGNKERLFLSVIEDTNTAQTAAFQALLDRTLGEVTDVPTALLAFGREFVTAVARSPERAAVIRLMIAEATHFPELLRLWRAVGPVQQSLAHRLTRLAEQGMLELPDQLEAAEYLGLLVTSWVNNRSVFGAVPLDDAEIDELVTSGVRVFLRAYRPAAG